MIEQLGAKLPHIAAVTGVREDTLAARLQRLTSAPDTTTLFECAGIVYRAPRDAAATGLAPASVDLVYSYAVLEHVPESVVDRLTAETRRILRPNSMAFHASGLHDHDASFDRRVSKVNSLKYPEWIWCFFVKNRISYHNGLREKEFLAIFTAQGARVVEIRNKIARKDVEAVQRMRINSRFNGITPSELSVTYSEILLAFG